MIGDETHQEYTPDQAVLESKATPDLFGVPLRPFSFSRKIAAQTMGCIAPGVPDFGEHLKTTGTYPGALNDVIIALWLCTLKDPSELTREDILAGEFTPERVLARPQDALAKAHVWGELHGLGDGLMSEKGFAAWKVFLGIMFAIDASVFEVKMEDLGGLKSREEPPKAKPGNPPSEHSSRGLRAKPATRRHTSGKK